MKITFKLAVAFFFHSLVGWQCLEAQGTAFTYQGRLTANGAAANGSYDFRFRLAEDALGTTYLGSPYLTNAVPVANGLFLTTLDFGAGTFTGSNYWLQVDVRTNGGGSYTTVTPLQPLTPAPNAIFASTANTLLGTLPAGQLSGTVANGNLPPSPTVTGTVTAGVFAGNGASITNVNAATLNGLAATNFWSVGGNAVLPGQFLGSLNNQPVVLAARGLPVVTAGYASNSMNGYAPNVVMGFAGNFVSNGIVGAAIGGGGSTNQWIYTPDGTGYGFFIHYGTNAVLGDFGMVPGGFGNTAQGVGSLAAGIYDTATGTAAMAMGAFCTASGRDSFVAGYSSVSSGSDSVALGGSATASNEGSVAMGETVDVGGIASLAEGLQTTASADQSAAMGTRAQALHQGAYVWGDSQAPYFASTANNQYLIRAQGGVGIGTNAPAGALDVASGGGFGAPQMQLDQQSADYARLRFNPLTNAIWDIAVQSSMNFFAGGYGNVMTLQNNGRVGIAAGTPTHLFQVGNAYCDGNTWSPASDRNLKSGFVPLDASAVLAKVAALPISRWHYTNDLNTSHVGPMAQDFYQAFATGADDRHISDVDEGGVALAAIQGLNQKLEAENTELQQRITKLEAVDKDNTDLRRQLGELSAMVEKLAAQK